MMYLNNKIALEEIEEKDCKSIGHMCDYLIELSFFLHKTSVAMEDNALRLRKTYKYFSRNEFNNAFGRLSELKRDLQIVRRKVELLENKLDDSTLPDNAPCFFFAEYLREIMQEIVILRGKYNSLINKISCKLILL